jgi:hypothetical protein
VKSDVLGPSLDKDSVRFDKWSRRPVYEDGGPGTSVLGGAHRDSRVPEGLSLPELEPFC